MREDNRTPHVRRTTLAEVAEVQVISAALTARIPAIEAPSEEREAPETVEQKPESQPRSDAPGAQEGAQRRPWWRRVFGGGPG